MDLMECVPVIDLCMIVGSFFSPVDIWLRSHLEGWQIPPTAFCTADKCLLYFAEYGGDMEIRLAITLGAVQLGRALRVAAKHNQQSAALLLLELGAMKMHGHKLRAALSESCAKLGAELDAIVASYARDNMDRDKVRNSMLYFRWSWANDANFRDVYITDDIQDALDNDEQLAQRKYSYERMLAEGSMVWKSHLTEKQQREVRLLYHDWRAWTRSS